MVRGKYQIQRIRGDMIEVFKNTHNLYESPITKSSLQSTYSTGRTNSYKKAKVSTKISKFVNYWNILPLHEIVVSVNTINSLKNYLERDLSAFIYDGPYGPVSNLALWLSTLISAI